MVRGIIKFASVAAALVVAPTAADAAFSRIQFDVNGLKVDAGGQFDGFTHTGQLSLTHDANTVLAAIIVDSVSFPTGASLTSFAGTIDLNVGAVTGGQFTVSLDDGSSYVATLSDGFVAPQAGQGFMISGLTFSGNFNGSSFGGVDVTGIAGVDGDFVLESYGPDSSGMDDETAIDVFAAPSPGPAAALLGAGALALGRRRRR